MRVPAGEVEGLVLDRLRQLLASRRDIADALASCGLTARELDLALRRAVELSQRWLTLPPKETRALARQVISRINLSPDGIEVAIGAAQLACALGAILRTEDAAEAPIRLAIAAELRRAGQGKRLVIGEPSDGASNSSLVRVLQEAFSAREALLAPSSESLNAITSRLTKSKGRLTALMRVSYLAPDIIEDMLAGRQPPELSPKRCSEARKGYLSIGRSSARSCALPEEFVAPSFARSSHEPPAPKVGTRDVSLSAAPNDGDFRLCCLVLRFVTANLRKPRPHSAACGITKEPVVSLSYLAVQAVRCEPVSGDESLFAGKKQGISAKIAVFG